MRTSHRLAVTLLALLGAVLYANTFGVPWYLDDYGAIVDQPAIRDLSRSLRGVLAPRGLGSFTFALNYWAGGVEPGRRSPPSREPRSSSPTRCRPRR